MMLSMESSFTTLPVFASASGFLLVGLSNYDVFVTENIDFFFIMLANVLDVEYSQLWSRLLVLFVKQGSVVLDSFVPKRATPDSYGNNSTKTTIHEQLE